MLYIWFRRQKHLPPEEGISNCIPQFSVSGTQLLSHAWDTCFLSRNPHLTTADIAQQSNVYTWIYLQHFNNQATGLDAWASRVKCPARFVSHLHDICIYIWVVYSFCLFCCLFIIVTTQFVALYKPCKPKPKPSAYDPPDNHPLAEIQIPILRPEPKQRICHQHANTDHFGK